MRANRAKAPEQNKTDAQRLRAAIEKKQRKRREARIDALRGILESKLAARRKSKTESLLAALNLKIAARLRALTGGGRSGRMDDDGGEWITVGGTPLKIGEGQDKDTAVQGFIAEKEAERAAKKAAEEQGGSHAEIGTLDNPSPMGANPELPGFTAKNLAKHWAGGESDHSEDYPGFTKEQYAQRALELARSPVSDHVLGYRAANGDIVRFDESTNDFVKSSKTGIKTMFKPNGRTRYFERQMLKDGGVTHG